MPFMDPQQIETLLNRIESADAPAGAAPVEPAQAQALAVLRRLAEGLPPAGADEPHFTLEQVRSLAAARGEAGGEWLPPSHLADCPLCLEAFEIVLAGEPPLAEAARRRFEALLEPQPAAPAAAPRPWVLRRWSVLVAAALILLAVGLSLVFHRGATSARSEDAGLAYVSGQAIPSGTTIADGATLVARQPARAAFADGSQVTLEKDTQLAIRQSLTGHTTIELHDGEVTAHVVRQGDGKRFGIRTDLCEVIVVGTRFSVTSRREQVQVFEGGRPREGQGGQEITAVTVRVDEGVVLVRHRRFTQEARLEAGQVAELRSNSPTIDIGAAPAATFQE